MNAQFTHIPVMYRDASNYKQYGTIVVGGAITDDQKQEIISLLDEGLYYAPEMIGLQHYGMLAVENGRWTSFGNEDDHEFQEMLVDQIEVRDSGVSVGDFEYLDNVAELISRLEKFYAAGCLSPTAEFRALISSSTVGGTVKNQVGQDFKMKLTDEMEGAMARCEEAVRAVARVFDGGFSIDAKIVDELESATNDLMNRIRRSE